MIFKTGTHIDSSIRVQGLKSMFCLRWKGSH